MAVLRLDVVGFIMARIPRQLPTKLLVLGISLTLLTIVADWNDWLEVPENWFYDARARHCQFFAPPPSPDIVHLDIDDAAMDVIGAWPWPRAIVADMMDEIRMAGPKAVLFDILYIDPARPEWKPETSPDGKTRFVEIDHDALLAAAFRRMGNAIIPVSLRIEAPPPITPLEHKLRDLLIKELECDEERAAKLVPMGVVPYPVWLGAYLSARRFAERQRVSELWDQIGPSNPADMDDAETGPAPSASASDSPASSSQPIETTQPTQAPTTQPEPITQPTTARSTQPGALVDLSMSRPSAGPLERQIIIALLPHTDLTLNSALLRTMDEAYRQVRSERVIRRLSFPIPPGLPTLYSATETAFPVPRLAAEAAGTAFVDYPTGRDGKVRDVPLMVEYEGRMYPQMGLALAARMLGVTPAEFRCTPDSITIPMAGRPNGKGGLWQRDIVIPVQTFYSPNLEKSVPAWFKIPWYGGKEWEAMYDPGHPRSQKQHVSINAVHDACETRRRIETANRKIDLFLQIIADFLTDDPSFHAFLDHAPPPQVPLSRHEIVVSTLKNLAAVLETAPDEKDMTDKERLFFRAIKGLRDGDKGSVTLADQLDRQRLFLRSQLHDKGVLVGACATGMDIKATSIHPAAPGVITHGTIVNAILTGRMWREEPRWVTMLITLAAGLMTIAIVTFLSPLWAVISSLGLALTYLLVNFLLLFDYGNILVGVAGPLIAVATVWSVCTLVRLLAERIERNRITKRFSNYVDPTLVEWVVKHPEQETFDGVTREMSMVFSDLVGFTTLTEKLGQKAIPILREYMGEMIPAIRAHGGLIGCLMGDGIYCFFGGAPEPDPEHAIHAVRSVYDMQARLDELNISFKKRGLPPLGMRVGVTTGTVIVGDGGCPPVRSDYTALGDPVNLAARLESANKQLGTSSLISGRTAELLNGSYLIRPVASLRVKGKDIAVPVFEPLCPTEASTPEAQRKLECTRHMVSSFQSAKFDACVAAADCLEREIAQSKKLAGLYRELSREYQANPPEDFDGSITLTEK
jgi:class 3 adenylate cyclase/CHASE2 domain-containing sensor protein